MISISQSVAHLCVFKAFLSSDHTTEATGKTIAITISKNGGAFGNPNAGATNATEITSGWYKVTLDTTDTNTLGPIAIRGAVATIDDVGFWYQVSSPPATASALAVVDGIVDDILLDTAEIGAAGAGLTNINLPNQTMDIVGNITGNLSGSVGSVTGLAATVWDEDATAHQTTGTFGQAIGDPVANTNSIYKAVVTDPSGATVGADTANILAGQGTALTNIDALPTNAELATALGTADDAVLAAIAALNNLSASQVNAEVVDALSTDTYAEPGQAAPGATVSLSAKINYLYKAWRNRHTQTASEYNLYNDDATTVAQKAAVSDDTTTFNRGEIASGP